jgi:hypothetical protein
VDVAYRLGMIARVERKSGLGQAVCLLLLLIRAKVDLLEGIVVGWELWYFEGTAVEDREVAHFECIAAEDQEVDHPEDIAAEDQEGDHPEGIAVD